MQHAALSCAIPAVSARFTASVRILLLECLDTNALVPYVNALTFGAGTHHFVCMCLRIMHVCVVSSNVEITGVYGNWYNARNEKFKKKETVMFFHQQKSHFRPFVLFT